MRLTVPALAASLLVAPASAQGLSTERLVELCRDPASAAWRDIGQWMCPSYIRGIIDGARLQAMHTAGNVEEHRRLMQFCVPETASGADAWVLPASDPPLAGAGGAPSPDASNSSSTRTVNITVSTGSSLAEPTSDE